MKKYTAISLFSGAMGLDLGVESTGRFKLLACVEKEKAFCDTIRLNKENGYLDKSLSIFHADISKLNPADVLEAAGLKPGELDVLIGGPPCQSFSTAGRRGTTQDPRGTLLWDFLRFVEYIKPRVFLMENVRGLVSAALNHRSLSERPERGGAPLSDDEKPGSVIRLFSQDLRRLQGAAYHMDVFEVNAVNYGAPQLRERVLFIGNRFGSEIDFPNPTHGMSNASEEGIPDLFSLSKPKLTPWRTLRDAIEGIEVGSEIMDFSPRKKHFLSFVPAGGNWRSLPLEMQQESMGRAWHAKGGRSGWWRRLNYDLPSPTLVTMPNHASTSLCHPTELRALSVKEYAAIQEFPKHWEFSGTVANKYAQIGNAVPVRLGMIAGQALAGALDRLEGQGSSLPIAKEDFRVVYIQSHIRTRQWFKQGRAYIWEDGGNNEGNKYDAPQTLRKSREIYLRGA